MTGRSPFRYFKISPEIIRLAVMMDVRFPLSLRNVEDRLHERGISNETIRFWWNGFVSIFAAEIGRRHGRAEELVTDRLRTYGGALKELCVSDRQKTGRWRNNRAESLHQSLRRREWAMLVSGECEVYRNSFLFTHRSSNNSTRSAPSPADRISNSIAPCN